MNHDEEELAAAGKLTVGLAPMHDVRNPDHMLIDKIEEQPVVAASQPIIVARRHQFLHVADLGLQVAAETMKDF